MAPKGLGGVPKGLRGVSKGLGGFAKGLWGAPKGLAGVPKGLCGFPKGLGGLCVVTKGMRAGAAMHIRGGGGEVPVSAPLVDDAVVVTFVACSSPRTATKRLVVVLLLDGDVLLLGRMLRVAVALARPGGRLG